MEYIDDELIKEASKALKGKVKIVADDDDPAVIDAANAANAEVALADSAFRDRVRKKLPLK